MLVNDIHLLPDLTGALICPKEKLVAFADPVTGDARTAPRHAAEAVRRMASVLRQRRPRVVVWLGETLPGLLAAGKLGARETRDLAALMGMSEWVWVGQSLPDGLDGHCVEEWLVNGLTFRLEGQPDAKPGDISARPAPVASCGGVTLPCYVCDGRRLVMPAFGPVEGGTDVLSPPLQRLFRRPFHVLMTDGRRIISRPRQALDGVRTPSSGGGGGRMSLMSHG